MTRTYYEKRFCDDCIAVHWVELTHQDKAICHGEEYSPHSDPTHYTRRSGRGVEVIEKIDYAAIAERYNCTDHAFTQYLLNEHGESSQ